MATLMISKELLDELLNGIERPDHMPNRAKKVLAFMGASSSSVTAPLLPQ